MASEVEICNLALSNIRAGSINSLDESNLQAQICKLKYALIRDRCLRSSWQFNKAISPLATIDVDIYNWAYAYRYPVNCLKINRIIPEYEEVTWGSDIVSRLVDTQILPITDHRRQVSYEVFNFSNVKVIGCNETTLHIDYAIRIEDPNLFSDDFILAFSHLLGSEIAVPIVGAEKGRLLRADEIQLYEEYIDDATASDTNDGFLNSPESEYVTVRR